MLLRDHSAFFRLCAARSERLTLWLGSVVLAIVTGCSPKIGDKCTVSTDCSAQGDRICDITEPGGYCTEFNCEQNSCPDNAACINFGTTLSIGDPGFTGQPNHPATVPAACMVSQGNSPYQRSFCLAVCESDSDCRPDYSCIEPETIGGVKSDTDSFRRGKVCAVARKSMDPTAAGNSDQVCIGSDAGISSTGGASGSSSGGAGGVSSSGASGESGAAGESAGGMSGAENAGAGG